MIEFDFLFEINFTTELFYNIDMNDKLNFITLKNLKENILINYNAIYSIEQITPANRNATINYLVDILGRKIIDKFYEVNVNSVWVEREKKMKSVMCYRVRYGNNDDSIIIDEKEYNKLMDKINIIF